MLGVTAGGDLIRNEIDEFFRDDSSLDDYDNWHYTLCKNLKAKYKNVTDGKTKFFTYGNAQKWVNMTIKYLCLIDALSDGFIYHKRLCEFQSAFHVPVDSYIIKAVLPITSIPLPISDEKRKEQKIAIDYVKSWSAWDCDEDEDKESTYNLFQKGIRKTIQCSSPLDWENGTWIEQAKKKKIQENRSIRSKYNDFFDEKDE